MDQAHHKAGEAVALAEEKGCTLSELTVADYAGIHELFTDDVTKIWDFEVSVDQVNAYPGSFLAPPGPGPQAPFTFSAFGCQPNRITLGPPPFLSAAGRQEVLPHSDCCTLQCPP